MKNNYYIRPDYSRFGDGKQLVLPIDTEILIPANDSVRLLSQVMEELEYSKLYEAYSPKGRKAAVAPKSLFKILVYGYMCGYYSSRALERACCRDINFMYLLSGEKAPDYSTIARFRSGRLDGVTEDLFRQLVEKLHERGDIRFDTLFVDGTKIESVANKYTFVWKKATEKNEAKLQVNVKKKWSQLFGEETVPEVIPATAMRTVLQMLLDKIESLGIQMVYGSGKRKTDLQREAEQWTEFLDRQAKYDDYNRLFDGRNSFSKTDPDATFMHMKEDHMQNAQLKPGYNIQIGVEGEYIVGVDVSNERSDQMTLVPFLKRLEELYKEKRFKDIVADAGYEGEENYRYLKENGYQTYIKPQNYEKSKTKAWQKNPYRRENMAYNPIEDSYTCPQGRKLKAVGLRKRKSMSGYVSTITKYACENCEDCPHKGKCTKSQQNRQMENSKPFTELRQTSLNNITTSKGILLRMNRSIQVEGAFGVIKEDSGFRRFLMRGKKNVRTEFLLMSMGYNINKLHAKIQGNRCDQLLHKKEIA